MLTFDLALPVFAGIVRDVLGEEALESYFFLRDVSGKLTFIVPDGFDAEKRKEIADEAWARVQPYVDGQGMAVASPSDLFDDRLRDPQDMLHVRVALGDADISVRVVDRRMVGADWVRNPGTALASKRLAFTSLKGGVGRTTALCVLAAALVNEGRRVLVVDLDLEAPGLGSMLLNENTLPLYGMLDFLVERGNGIVDDEFLTQMVGSSWLGAGRGLLDVIPAAGRLSDAFPENVLGKIARAYLASTDEKGRTTTFADHVAVALDRLAERHQYDAILVDARAGLHETTAASILGLGAHVLCFGLDQPQTYADYKLLFAHLATIAPAATAASQVEPTAGFEWADALILVQGKAPASTSGQARFVDRMTHLIDRFRLQSADPLELKVSLDTVERKFDVDWDETEIDVAPVPEEGGVTTCRILSDARYSSFDPLSDQSVFDDSVYDATYGQFIDVCRTVLSLDLNGY